MGALTSHPIDSEDHLLKLQLLFGVTDTKFKKVLSFEGQPIADPATVERVAGLKKKCLPANVEYREDFSKVKLQDLLDHTAQRFLLTYPENVILEMESELVLRTKWGIGDTENPFKNWRVTILEHFADYGLYITVVCPMQLADSSGKIHFECTKKGLENSCRPVKLQFHQLSKQWIKEEREQIQKDIDELKPTEVEMHGKNFVIRHEVLLCEGKKKPTQRRRQTAQQVPLPVDDVCEQAYGMGEELLMEYLDVAMEGRMAVANREAFDTIMAASDPYMIARMKADDRWQ